MDKLLERVGVEVVGRATDGAKQALAMVKDHRPDVLIAGVDASDKDQMAWVGTANEARPDLRCSDYVDTRSTSTSKPRSRPVRRVS